MYLIENVTEGLTNDNESRTTSSTYKRVQIKESSKDEHVPQAHLCVGLSLEKLHHEKRCHWHGRV